MHTPVSRLTADVTNGVISYADKLVLHRSECTLSCCSVYCAGVTNYQCMVHNVLSKMWNVCIMASIWRKLMGYGVRSQKEKREHCVCKKR